MISSATDHTVYLAKPTFHRGSLGGRGLVFFVQGGFSHEHRKFKVRLSIWGKIGYIDIEGKELYLLAA